MAQKQDPPKKLMAPKGKMTPPSRKKMLERVDKVIKRTVKPKAASRIIKKALAQGDQSSAANSFTARTARKIATGAGKALKSMAANKDTVNLSKALTSPKARAMQDSTLKAYVAKTGRMPMGLKVDSTKKVMPGGGSNPSIMIKKETKIRRPTIGGSIPFPVRPEKSEKSNNPKGLYKK